MCFVKIPAILTTVKYQGCVLSAYTIALGSRITFFEKNAFLTLPLFFLLFSCRFHEAPTMLGFEIFKQCMNVCFVSTVMLSMSKLNYFK